MVELLHPLLHPLPGLFLPPLSAPPQAFVEEPEVSAGQMACFPPSETGKNSITKVRTYSLVLLLIYLKKIRKSMLNQAKGLGPCIPTL